MHNFVRKNQIKEYALFIGLAVFAIILSVRRDTSDVVMQGIKLWAVSLLPSLFPYFFISAALASLKVTGKLALKFSPLSQKAFNVNGLCFYAFIMSVISGYPLGSQIVAELRLNNLIGKEESVRAAAFCSTSSPVFLIGCVGGVMFDDIKFGVLLFICHIVSVITVGIIFSFYKRNVKPAKVSSLPLISPCDDVLADCSYSAVLSALKVGAIITLFYTLTETLSSIGALYLPEKVLTFLLGDQTAATALTYGILESTRGYVALAQNGLSTFSLPICAFFCGFGGLSVIVQSLTFLKKAKIKAAAFCGAKLLTAFISVIIAVFVNKAFYL